MAAPAFAQKKPNILVVMGDDIGMWNVGIYTHGMMAKTPNIERIGREGILFARVWSGNQHRVHSREPDCAGFRAQSDAVSDGGKSRCAVRIVLE